MMLVVAVAVGAVVGAWVKKALSTAAFAVKKSLGRMG
jgi:hypothetical protein